MPRALLSVWDKRGLRELAQGLVELGFSLLASGGTARHLADLGVIEVADYTGAPEILEGRVKTLHPAIHGPILARTRDLAELEWEPIDLVVVNLYPFEETVARGATPDETTEQIDIGGVALMRAAAKNHERVTLLSDPADYAAVLGELREGGVGEGTRRRLAGAGFERTCRYDAAIAAWLKGVTPLRYGENPHQAARLYGAPLGGQLLQGKELSYNNLLDLDAAWRAVQSFDEPAVCIVKHLSPCGIAVGDELASAFVKALACDPISAFGGVIAANRPVDAGLAEALGELFVECIVAPGFCTHEALTRRGNCRLLQVTEPSQEAGEWRSLPGGTLWQERDLGDPAGTVWKVVSQRPPSPQEERDLAFAWKACQHVKSNAIVLAREGATVGIGGGQPNRVDCVRLAAERAGVQARGAVMASDAFFPFPDSVERAIAAGVTAVIHPGGSRRDGDSLRVVDEAGLAMVVTGVRHFRH